MKPLMDVVILSKASTDELRLMTQRCIDSAVRGAPGQSLNVIVMEQVPDITYQHATTVEMTEPFAYNRFANLGAKYGEAEWIMVANNDLYFEHDWLAPMLAANHGVMSPRDPRHHRQRLVKSNTVGDQIGLYFSGWCFVIRRTLWEKIGGFDEDFTFWCADDAVVQQVRRAGVTPMLISSSRVHHFGSVTHDQIPEGTEERTWEQVYKFEQKYRVPKFQGHRGYQRWKIQRARQGR